MPQIGTFEDVQYMHPLKERSDSSILNANEIRVGVLLNDKNYACPINS